MVQDNNRQKIIRPEEDYPESLLRKFRKIKKDSLEFMYGKTKRKDIQCSR